MCIKSFLNRAPPNDSMVWLSCSFQTVGSSYYTIAAALWTHWGGNTPSVSNVGPNQKRVLTVTISRMKMLFTSGELCPPTRWGPYTEHVNTELNTGGKYSKAARLRKLLHLLYFHHRGESLRRKYLLWQHREKLLWFACLCKQLGGPLWQENMLFITIKLYYVLW